MSGVLITIILRNNLALSKLAIKSALAQQPACDVLCLNNASTDGTAAYISAKNVAVVSLQKQLSLAACWNMALRAAWRMKYEAVLMLNNDLEIRIPDTVRLLSSHGGEFVTCVSVDKVEQLTQADVGWRKEDLWMERMRNGEREHPDFSAFLIRKSVTDRGLWFNENYYPAYCEDSDFHVRCHRAGVRCVCIDLPFLHHGASTLKQANHREAVIIRRGADRNRERFRLQYGCLPGTPEYEKLFSPETFGIDCSINRMKRQDTPSLDKLYRRT